MMIDLKNVIGILGQESFPWDFWKLEKNEK